MRKKLDIPLVAGRIGYKNRWSLVDKRIPDSRLRLLLYTGATGATVGAIAIAVYLKLSTLSPLHVLQGMRIGRSERPIIGEMSHRTATGCQI